MADMGGLRAAGLVDRNTSNVNSFERREELRCSAVERVM
jgi:hypothetical protein